MKNTFNIGDKIIEKSVVGIWYAQIISMMPIPNLPANSKSDGYAYMTAGFWINPDGTKVNRRERNPKARQLWSNHFQLA
jgi:hypothetical protein